MRFDELILESERVDKKLLFNNRKLVTLLYIQNERKAKRDSLSYIL
jgi:hypothetical protein